MTSDKASVGSGRILDSKEVSLGGITDINKADMFGTDAFHLAFHKSLQLASRSKRFRTERWSKDEGRTNSDKLESLVLRQGSLKVPCSLLSKHFALEVSAHSFGAIGVAPMAFVIGSIGRFVGLCHN